MRGLKLHDKTMDELKAEVASLADAWIEIIAKRLKKPDIGVASLADAWIEIFWNKGYISCYRCRIPRGCVD